MYPIMGGPVCCRAVGISGISMDETEMSSLGSVGGAALRAVSLAGYVLLFLLTTAFLVNDTYNPFLYFRF